MNPIHAPHALRSLATLLAAAALVPADAAAAGAQQAPQPAPEIRRLAAITGTFEGEAVYTANCKTVRFTLRHENRVVSGGYGIACHEQADVPGMGRYDAENLFGWDPGRGRLHLFTVTNDPQTHDHAGRWTDATHAVLRYEGVRQGEPMVEDLPIQLVGPDEYRFTSTVTVAGRQVERFQATMKRVDGMAKR